MFNKLQQDLHGLPIQAAAEELGDFKHDWQRGAEWRKGEEGMWRAELRIYKSKLGTEEESEKEGVEEIRGAEADGKQRGGSGKVNNNNNKTEAADKKTDEPSRVRVASAARVAAIRKCAASSRVRSPCSCLRNVWPSV